MKNLHFYLLVAINLVLAFIYEKLLRLNDLMLDSLLANLTERQFQEFLGIQEKWKWFSYFLVPILILIKTSIISAILDAGCFFF